MWSIKDITSPPLSFVFVLFPCRQALASPVPQIIEPRPGPLAFLELVQNTWQRIIEDGFLRGVLPSLLILGCLACLLIGALYGLVAYRRHHDTKLWERHEEINVFDDEKDEEVEPTLPAVEECRNRPITRHNYKLQSHSQSRVSHYLIGNPSIPITKIGIRASLFRASTAASALSAPCGTAPRTPTRTPATPLRSALSKSPPSSKRSLRVRTLLFGSRRVGSGPNSSPTAKSVHWADEIEVTPVEMGLTRERVTLVEGHISPHIETDIGTRTIGGHNLKIGDELQAFSLATYHSDPVYQTQKNQSPFSTTPIIAKDTGHLSGRITSMKLEGDTS